MPKRVAVSMDPLFERLVASAVIGAVFGLGWEISLFRFVVWTVLFITALIFVFMILVSGLGALISEVERVLFSNKMALAFAGQLLVGFFAVRIAASIVRSSSGN